jgi:DNA-binding NarL/FixJ family response regulator
MSMTRKRVVLADDHPIVLAGIKALIQSAPDFELVGEATDGLSALELIRAKRPDLAVIDLSMPGLNGAELCRRLVETCPSVSAVVLTVQEEPAYVHQLLRAGARGYVLKRSASEELLRALRAVVASGVYIDPAVAAKMLAIGKKPALTVGSLSEREAEVLKFAARGLSNKEIALRLDLSVKTIETYKARAMEKLGLKTRADIVRHGSGEGWISDL